MQTHIRQETVVTNLIQSLLETWNEAHVGQKLSPELIKLIVDHFRMAYVSGFDDIANEMLNELRKARVPQSSDGPQRTVVSIARMEYFIKEYGKI